MFFEEKIENDLGTIFKALNHCVTQNYDAFISDQKRENNQTCITDGDEVFSIAVANLAQAANDCTYEITGDLFHFVSINLKIHDESWTKFRPYMKDYINKICMGSIINNLEPLKHNDKEFYPASSYTETEKTS